MSMRSVFLTRLLTPVSILAAAGTITVLLQGHPGATESHPRLSAVADSTSSPVSANSSASAQPAASVSATPAAASAPVADAALRSAVAQANGAASVSVTDLSTGQSLTYGAPGHGFATASIVKVDILSTLLLQAQDQGTTLTAAQQSLATTMIENSDNDSATALWNEIGQESGLNAANQRFGLTSTSGGTDGNWGLTSTTAADQVQLLRQVFTSDSQLSSASRGYIQGLLGQVESDQRWGVSAAASGSDYAVKDGWLPRSATGLWVINSIGMVERDGHELLIAAVSDGNPSESGGISLVQSVAQAAAGSLNGS
ncbi:serine hydrolase [Kitasatospora sp. NPDC052896]|uniref:serine hydrolase n=1 Tax=Kitasatospora sp. NPDC052896 TaxID=3364061 RepID=UPI0037CC6329